jgi:hypothetical protein
VSPTCPACPSPWIPKPGEPFFCCLDGNCYSQATGIIDLTTTFSTSSCSGSASGCSCSLHSIDGHAYALTCSSAACSCTKDGAVVKSLPWLCPSAGALEASFVLWACGFPPI